MRIVLLVDDFLPESTKIHAKMFYDLALEFIGRGHQVVVIVPGSWNQKQNLIVDCLDGIEVWRFKSKPTRGVGKVRRAINETMLSWRAYRAIASRVRLQAFDLCVNYSPTIFYGPLAYYLKRLGAYNYLVLRDFFPQWVIDQGMIKSNSLIAKYFRYFEHFNYKVSDCVAVQSKANLKLFHDMYKSHDNVKVLMNWAAVKQSKTTISAGIRKKLTLNGKVIFFYGGNIGHAQDMSNILRLAKRCLPIKEAHFLLVGQGDEFSLVLDTIRNWGLLNTTLLPSVSQDDYKNILKEVDVGLFSLSSKHRAHNFPGKLLGYMAESLPILGSVNAGNDVLEVLNDGNAGLVTINGVDDEFFSNAIEFVRNNTLRDKMGAASFELLKRQFSVSTAVDEILDQVKIVKECK